MPVWPRSVASTKFCAPISLTAVAEIGAQNFVLATDLGQTGNPSHADGLQVFVMDLMQAGLSKDEITKMGREVTGSLLMG